MQALVYRGPGSIALEVRPEPVLKDPTDAIVRLTSTSICGTDLHIMRGDVPTIPEGRILGHEGVGVVEAVGTSVRDFSPGDRVLISLITSCGHCDYCRRGMPSHCRSGGWLLGNTLDGTQAERVRIPFADNGLHALPSSVSDGAAVMLSCNLPTSLECGVMAAQIRPGDRVAIVGAGPVGLATIMAAELFSPSQIIVVDYDLHRLELALALGATATVAGTGQEALGEILGLTHGEGVDAAIEAVGTAGTFEFCQSILAPGGHLANVGVHGHPAPLHLERLWAANVTLTTQLVDAQTTARLLSMVVSGRLKPERLISHRYALSEAVQAYRTFGMAASQHAVKILLEVSEPPVGANR